MLVTFGNITLFNKLTIALASIVADKHRTISFILIYIAFIGLFLFLTCAEENNFFFFFK